MIRPFGKEDYLFRRRKDEFRAALYKSDLLTDFYVTSKELN